jgi:hypothetical protein
MQMTRLSPHADGPTAAGRSSAGHDTPAEGHDTRWLDEDDADRPVEERVVERPVRDTSIDPVL